MEKFMQEEKIFVLKMKLIHKFSIQLMLNLLNKLLQNTEINMEIDTTYMQLKIVNN
jgi:hypothetical protein